MRGKLITFEGIDGSGKSSQIELTRNFLESENKKTIITREPGGTNFGEKLRSLILNSDQILAETEVLLMFAARLEHLHKVIFPALKNGAVVLCDRFTDATYAYQGGGGVELEKIKLIEEWVHPKFQPDLTFYFKMPVNLAIQRIAATRDFDKFEEHRIKRFTKIQEIYESRASSETDRFIMIDAEMEINEVSKSIIKALNIFFTRK